MASKLAPLNEHAFYGLPPRSTTKLSDAEREKLLDTVLLKKVPAGGTVQMRANHQVVLEYKAKRNDVLHLILSIITLGLWLIVWFFVAISSKTKHENIAVDEYGVVTSSGAY